MSNKTNVAKGFPSLQPDWILAEGNHQTTIIRMEPDTKLNRITVFDDALHLTIRISTENIAALRSVLDLIDTAR